MVSQLVFLSPLHIPGQRIAPASFSAIGEGGYISCNCALRGLGDQRSRVPRLRVASLIRKRKSPVFEADQIAQARSLVLIRLTEDLLELNWRAANGAEPLPNEDKTGNAPLGVVVRSISLEPQGRLN